MSFLGRLRRLTRNFISHGFGPGSDAPPVVPTTQGCIQARTRAPASILASVRPAAIIEATVAPATIIEARARAPASILSTVRPAAIIESRVVAC